MYFSKVMVDQLVKRFDDKKQKSAMLITTSGLAERPLAGTLTYSVCKSFAGYIGEGLNFELNGKVDVINYQAGEVATKLLRRFETDSRTITPDIAA